MPTKPHDPDQPRGEPSIDTTGNLTSDSIGNCESPACVVQIYGTPLGRRIPLARTPLRFGRVDGNEIVVADPSVSREHARIFPRAGDWWIEDLGSRNGTRVNGVDLPGPAALASGDQVKIGRAVFKFLASGEVESLFHEAIRQMTVTDGLTGVANRRHLEDFLARELVRAERYDRSLSVVLFDLDHFKRINDDRGHLAGDEVLRCVAAAVAAEVRQDELIARYGGEEFTVVLPELEGQPAHAAAERYRAVIESCAIAFDQRPIAVTASFGLASRRSGDTTTSLLQRADERLYQAKSAGRNRVVGDSDS